MLPALVRRQSPVTSNDRRPSKPDSIKPEKRLSPSVLNAFAAEFREELERRHNLGGSCLPGRLVPVLQAQGDDAMFGTTSPVHLNVWGDGPSDVFGNPPDTNSFGILSQNPGAIRCPPMPAGASSTVCLAGCSADQPQDVSPEKVARHPIALASVHTCALQ